MSPNTIICNVQPQSVTHNTQQSIFKNIMIKKSVILKCVKRRNEIVSGRTSNISCTRRLVAKYSSCTLGFLLFTGKKFIILG